MKERIRRIVNHHARLSCNLQPADDAVDLYRAGMTSHASVALMLALELEFDLEFPDSMLSRSVFESVDSITNAIENLQQVKQ